MKNGLLATSMFFSAMIAAEAQQKAATAPTEAASSAIPISNADLGTFPYFKTLPNFRPMNESDSATIEQNRTYFFDGKTCFAIDGQVSAQRLSVDDSKKKLPSEFQIIQEFDKMVSTLGGKKIYTGKLPEDQLKKLSTYDLVELASKHQIAPNAYYGVIEYVIKSPQKEVWIQLVPRSIASDFYNILVVEKQNNLLTTNINKENLILKTLEKSAKAVATLSFEPDNATMLTESKDELMNILGVFQAHPDWKIKIEVHNAPVGKPDYTLALTEKRAAAVKEQLVALGVKPSSVEAKGLGDTRPVASNETEKGRQTNTRAEISKL